MRSILKDNLTFFLLAANLILLFAGPILATPLPYSRADIERRWAAGHSETQIHSGQTHRDMTPAWPMARDADASGVEDLTTDARTMLRGRETESLRAQVAAVVDALVHGRFFAGEKRGAEEEAPVLKPRRGFRYRFNQ